MTNVISVIRVMPEGLEVDIKQLELEIKKLGAIQIAEKPVAFGLKAIEATFSVPDSTGGTEEIEEKLRAMEGVSSVEVISMGREI